MRARTATRDRRRKPIVNLANNPKFVRAAPGATNIRTNLCLASTVKSVTVAGRNSGVGGASTLTASATDGPFAGTGYVQAQWTQAPTSDPMSQFVGVNWCNQPVVPGRVYSDTIYVWSSINQNFIINVVQRKSDGSVAGETYGTVPVYAPANTWTKLSYASIKALPAAAGFEVRARVANTGGVLYPVGGIMRVSAVLHECSVTVRPFFHGGMTDSSGFAYAWAGTADSSASYARSNVGTALKNFFTSPGALNGGVFGFWAGNNGTGSVSIVDAAWSVSGKAVRATTTGATSGMETIGPTLNNMGLTAGTIYTVEWDIVLSASGGNIYPTFSGASHTGFSMVATSPSQAVVAGTIIHLWATFTAGTGTNIRASGAWTARPADGWSEVSNVVIYQGRRTPKYSYFDGDISPDGDLTPVWEGTPGASPSVLRFISAANAVSGNYAKAFLGYLDDRWLLRVMPDGPELNGTEGWAIVAGSPGSSQMDGLNVTFQSGRTYTVKCRMYIPEPQTNNFGHSRRIQLLSGATAASWIGATSTQSNAAPNTAGWHELQVTGKMLDVSAWAGIRIASGGGLGGGDVYLTDLMIVEGLYNGPYMDGNSPDSVWLGSPNQAASAGYVLAS